MRPGGDVYLESHLIPGEGGGRKGGGRVLDRRDVLDLMHGRSCV